MRRIWTRIGFSGTTLTARFSWSIVWGLAPYFSERVLQHERMRLFVIDVRGQEGLPSTAGGSLVAARAADDLPGELARSSLPASTW